jgi:hypothetical protein
LEGNDSNERGKDDEDGGMDAKSDPDSGTDAYSEDLLNDFDIDRLDIQIIFAHFVAVFVVVFVLLGIVVHEIAIK